jgi:hypothetical protein
MVEIRLQCVTNSVIHIQQQRHIPSAREIELESDIAVVQSSVSPHMTKSDFVTVRINLG